ncbi:MAG TPA: hypothetical protein VGX78_23105, partial [Pirellulales bacterium]|nr:hypothetical protein [Pirellulales bacterium]
MNEHDNPRDELEDRWTDQALAEAVRGKRPPDLTARIMAAARPTRFVLHPLTKLALAASLLVAIGFGVFAVSVHQTHRNWTAEEIDFTGGVAAHVQLDKSRGMQAQREGRGGHATAELDARMQGYTNDMRHLRDARHRGFVDALYSVETSHVPTPDEPPILYPDPEVWRMLTERRKKYTTVESLERASTSGVIARRQLNEARAELTELDARLAARIQAAAKVRSALSERTELDFTDQPLSDVIDYLKNRHEIEIQIDDKALADAGVGNNTTVTRNLKGISLRAALRLLL